MRGSTEISQGFGVFALAFIKLLDHFVDGILVVVE
jgi:hypothetical protein